MGKNKYKPSVSKSAGSFLRTIGKNVEPGAAILVVTEGVNTEPTYFEALKNAFASPSVELVPHGAGRGDPKKLTDAALEFRKNRRKDARDKKLSISQLEDFDQIWIVFALRAHVVRQVIPTIDIRVGECWKCTSELAEGAIQPRCSAQHTVRAVVHKNQQAQLATANQHHCKQISGDVRKIAE